ncbi:MAG: fatty acid hydroxylase family protein [Deltaproteobacteria bacterium]|nr:MAG: fatty acid hydroxylase family protein [Deltaproteobacteria bacterium]
MPFTVRREPLTQHLLPAALLATAVGVGSTTAFATVWTQLTTLPDRWLVTGGLLLLHTLIFWPVCAAFHYVDTHDQPRFIARHRIQNGRRKHPALGPTVRVLLRNQFVLLPPLLLLTGEVLLARGWTAEATLPSLPRLALELGGQAVIAVIVFYAAHRFLHRKWWMKRVHRIHHEFKTTTAWASEYAHPVEFVVGNYASLALGALILAPHLASIYLFAAMALVNILVHHSGYALPWAPWSQPHDWHHYKMNELFGTTGLLDRLLGTSPEYEALEKGEVP